MGLLNNELMMYRAALSKQMGYSQWYQIPVWSDLTGFIGGLSKHGYPESVPYGAAKDRKLKPTGKVIEVLVDLHHQSGSWEMDIPILIPFRKKPIVGDDQAKGKEEQRAWVYNKAYMTQVRKPVKISDGAMGDMALSPTYLKQLYDTIKQELEYYNKRLQAYSPYDAILRGYDNNLIETKELPECFQKSHINFYVAGYGKVPLPSGTMDPTQLSWWQSYENNIVTQLDALANGTSRQNKLRMKDIRNLQLIGSELMFVPTTAGPYPVKGVLILNDRQMAQLAEDPLFEKVHLALATNAGDKAPLFSGAYEAHLCEGVLILVDVNAPGATLPSESNYVAPSGGGIIQYGNPNPLENPIHNSNIKLALYMSASAILCANVKRLQFKNEFDDYENVRGEASVTTIGYNRADRYDWDNFLASGQKLTNTSSLVLATYSPQTISWV